MKKRYPKNQKPRTLSRKVWRNAAANVDLSRGMTSWKNDDIVLAIIYYDGRPYHVFTADNGEWDFSWCPDEGVIVAAATGSASPYVHRSGPGTQMWVRHGCGVSFEKSFIGTRPLNPWAARKGERFRFRLLPNGERHFPGFPRKCKADPRPTRRKLAGYQIRKLAAPLVIDGSANPFEYSISEESGEAVYCDDCGHCRFATDNEIPCGHMVWIDESGEWVKKEEPRECCKAIPEVSDWPFYRSAVKCRICGRQTPEDEEFTRGQAIYAWNRLPQKATPTSTP